MKWLEIIELRSAGDVSEELKKKLILLIRKITEDTDKDSLKLYAHVNVKSDFSIHILHSTEKILYSGSELALHIISNLKSFGLINHNVWQKITSDGEEPE